MAQQQHVTQGLEHSRLCHCSTEVLGHGAGNERTHKNAPPQTLKPEVKNCRQLQSHKCNVYGAGLNNFQYEELPGVLHASKLVSKGNRDDAHT